jgi:hypothetical protein
MDGVIPDAAGWADALSGAVSDVVVQAGRANMAAIASMELRMILSLFLIDKGVMPLGGGQGKQTPGVNSAWAAS